MSGVSDSAVECEPGFFRTRGSLSLQTFANCPQSVTSASLDLRLTAGHLSHGRPRLTRPFTVTILYKKLRCI